MDFFAMAANKRADRWSIAVIDPAITQDYRLPTIQQTRWIAATPSAWFGNLTRTRVTPTEFSRTLQAPLKMPSDCIKYEFHQYLARGGIHFHFPL
jgi:hypothetical protein